jgi:hypothetical protein
MQLCSVSSSAEFIPATPWMEAADAAWGRASFEIRARSANIEVAPAWEVGNVEDDPKNHQQLDTPKIANGMFYPPAGGWTDMLSAATAPTRDRMLVRFGWTVRRTSGSGAEIAAVAGVVEFQSR